MNIYKQILKNNIPRLVTLYNLDNFSATYGYGDRLFWGWKASDFVNGTFQGGVHSLSIAVKMGLLENEKFVLNVIDSVIRAIDKIRLKNGSMEEAFPNESSFCVTALVAFDVLSAIDLLFNKISKIKKDDYLKIIAPLIKFISTNEEKHAIISNHLSTALAAILLWKRLANDNNQKFKRILEIIYRNQSQEGWFKEYEGADPGYQTLCTYYLCIAYNELNDNELKNRLNKSAEFLKYFIHPDGTIGGLYGSRNTEVYYPAGIIGLADISEDFLVIAKELTKGTANGNNIYPENIDTGNFTPLLNSYARAALFYEEHKEVIEEGSQKPPYASTFEKDFKDSGIFIKSTSDYYAIINYKKGGTVKVFDKKLGKIDLEDGGLFGVLNNGTRFSTQQLEKSNDFSKKEIMVNFYKVNEAYPKPLDFIFIRFLSLTFLKSLFLSNLFKKSIVKKLFVGKHKIEGCVRRKFEFFEDKIIISEQIDKPRKCKFINHLGKCKAIHMASSGYYNKQIEQSPIKSKFVEFKQQ